ncbi:hypothetical protein [Halarchaeum sp. P4]|uniref:hypothetical protein n=1 Tax=Halarchaeum sp. P4 TaxID=3421639 RepID=UPI003EB72EBC
MEELAEEVREGICEAVGEEPLVGVSYYTGERVGHVYRSDWAEEKYEPGQVDEIVRDMQLEAIGYGAHEQRQEEQLHATVRIYDDLLDIAVPIDGSQGVGVALDLQGEYSIRKTVALIEETIEESSVASREPVFRV